MKPRTKTIRFIIPIVLSLLVGCSSNSPTTSVPRDPTKAAERVTQANQILVPRIGIIVARGGDSASLNLASASSLYREAVSFDDENLDAHFGLGITELLTVFSDTLLAGVGVFILPDFSAQPVIAALNQGGYQQFIAGSFAKSKGTIKTLARPDRAVAGILAKRQVDYQPSYYQDLIETRALPPLKDAISHLQRVTQNSAYAFLITPQLMGVDSGPTYRIDLTEIYLLLAVAQYFTGEASMYASYNIDYNSSSQSSVVQAWQVSSSFLTLRPNGAQHMKDTRSSLIGFASSVKNAITFLMNEQPHKETDIITYNPSDQPMLTSEIESMNSLVSEFSGPMTENGVTINLVNLFDTPVTNFKAKVPAYTATAVSNGQGKYDAILTWDASSFDTWIFPDPTFNGFLPGMTDPQLKQMFELNAATWKPTVTIPG